MFGFTWNPTLETRVKIFLVFALIVIFLSFTTSAMALFSSNQATNRHVVSDEYHKAVQGVAGTTMAVMLIFTGLVIWAWKISGDAERWKDAKYMPSASRFASTSSENHPYNGAPIIQDAMHPNVGMPQSRQPDHYGDNDGIDGIY